MEYNNPYGGIPTNSSTQSLLSRKSPFTKHHTQAPSSSLSKKHSWMTQRGTRDLARNFDITTAQLNDAFNISKVGARVFENSMGSTMFSQLEPQVEAGVRLNSLNSPKIGEALQLQGESRTEAAKGPERKSVFRKIIDISHKDLTNKSLVSQDFMPIFGSKYQENGSQKSSFLLKCDGRKSQGQAKIRIASAHSPVKAYQNPVAGMNQTCTQTGTKDYCRKKKRLLSAFSSQSQLFNGILNEDKTRQKKNSPQLSSSPQETEINLISEFRDKQNHSRLRLRPRPNSSALGMASNKGTETHNGQLTLNPSIKEQVSKLISLQQMKKHEAKQRFNTKKIIDQVLSRDDSSRFSNLNQFLMNQLSYRSSARPMNKKTKVTYQINSNIKVQTDSKRPTLSRDDPSLERLREMGSNRLNEDLEPLKRGYVETEHKGESPFNPHISSLPRADSTQPRVRFGAKGYSVDLGKFGCQTEICRSAVGGSPQKEKNYYQEPIINIKSDPQTQSTVALLRKQTSKNQSGTEAVSGDDNDDNSEIRFQDYKSSSALNETNQRLYRIRIDATSYGSRNIDTSNLLLNNLPKTQGEKQRTQQLKPATASQPSNLHMNSALMKTRLRSCQQRKYVPYSQKCLLNEQAKKKGQQQKTSQKRKKVKGSLSQGLFFVSKNLARPPPEQVAKGISYLSSLIEYQLDSSGMNTGKRDKPQTLGMLTSAQVTMQQTLAGIPGTQIGVQICNNK